MYSYTWLQWLLFLWMGLGELLCLRKEASLGKQRLPSPSFAADLWQWCNRSAVCIPSHSRQSRPGLFRRCGSGNSPGIGSWPGDGAVVQG